MKRVAVLFGGVSVEHEISVISALQAIGAIDTTQFTVIPVYIAQSGRWYVGDRLLDKAMYKELPQALEMLQEVTLLPFPGTNGLTTRAKSGFLSRWTGKDETIPVDLFFPIFHGQYGEDGCIQGLLELAQVPYVGSDVTASSIAMNKYLCKLAAKAIGIPTLPGVLLGRAEIRKDLSRARKQIFDAGLTFPLFVKPCHLGSSIGVSRATDEAALDAALVQVCRFDTHALVEPCVTKIMEINVSVRDGKEPAVSVVEIPVASDGVLSYEDKYLRSGGSKGKAAAASEGMASLTRVIDPQDLDPNYKTQVQESAYALFKALGSSGVGRFDFIVDLEKGQLFFNELNPIPGSLSFYLWEKCGPPVLFTELLTSIMDRALERYAVKRELEQSVGFKALAR